MELLVGDINVILRFLEEHDLHLQEGAKLLPSDLYLIDKLDGPVGVYTGQTHEDCWNAARAVGTEHGPDVIWTDVIWTLRQKET